MEESKKASYIRILKSYKDSTRKVMIITKADFVYTAKISEVFDDSFSFSDKFGNDVILCFEEIKSIGGIH